MINQPGLYNLYRQMTGKSKYQVKILQDQPDQRWQASRVQEYAFQGVSEVS